MEEEQNQEEKEQEEQTTEVEFWSSFSNIGKGL